MTNFVDVFFEKFEVFSTLKESGYLLEPIGVKDYLQRGIKDIQKGPKSNKQQLKLDFSFKI